MQALLAPQPCKGFAKLELRHSNVGQGFSSSASRDRSRAPENGKTSGEQDDSCGAFQLGLKYVLQVCARKAREFPGASLWQKGYYNWLHGWKLTG